MVRTSIFVIFAAFLAACTQDEPVTATRTPTPERSSPTPGPMATDSPSPTPADTPKPPAPTIDVDDQTINDSSLVLVNKVTLDQPGWLVIQSDDDGAPGYVVGYSQVENLESEDISVPIDPKMATSELYAVLYIDRGIAGVFEFPGPDTPVSFDGQSIFSSFSIINRATLPSLTVSDQKAAENGRITIESVRTLADGYLALHNDQDGAPGPILAFVPIKAGLRRDLTITVNWTSTTPAIYAVLYEDQGVIGRFDPDDEDPVVYVLEQPVASSFLVQFPPDIFVYDQPIVGESIVVEKAVSYGPGWLVLYNDDEGSIGMIIGWAALDDGINEGIEIVINPSAATPILYLMIHEDMEDIGQFEFPRTDPAVLVENRVPRPFMVRINSGNYLITEDQLPNDSLISIPLAVVNQDAWVVVRADNDGELGDIVGLSWVPAGVNHDVSVALEEQPLTRDLYVVLHLDGGISQEFEYPDGLDIPLQRNRTIISAPMTLLTSDDE